MISIPSPIGVRGLCQENDRASNWILREAPLISRNHKYEAIEESLLIPRLLLTLYNY